MIKKILIFSLFALTSFSLVACTKEEEKGTNEAVKNEFLSDYAIVDGEIQEQELNTSKSDTISVVKDSSFNLKEILSAMYGDDIKISNIVCSEGVSEINGDTVTCHSNSVIEFYMEHEGNTTHQELKILIN